LLADIDLYQGRAKALRYIEGVQGNLLGILSVPWAALVALEGRVR
jgi:hypothetical protein